MLSSHTPPTRLFLFAALLFGCGGPAATDPLLMTCDVRSGSGTYAGQCIQWHGDATDPTNANVDMALICPSSYSGTTLQGACPSEAVVGTCSKTPTVAKRLVLTNYYPPGFDQASARSNCQGQGGTFAAR